MKILFCGGALSKGGAERVISNLANYFIKTDEIKIVSTMKTDIGYKIDEKVDIEFLDNEYSYKDKKIIKNIKRLKKLNKAINKFKPDIIVAFLPEPSFLTLMLKKINKIPIIISIRNDPKIEYKSKIYKLLMKKLYPTADGVVFQTEEAKAYFKNILKKSQKIIPNPINKEFIISKYEGERKKEIVNVGRLQEQKNQKMLIEAFSKLPEKYDCYKLIIYGEGNLKDELSELVKKKGLQERVIFAGTSDNIKEKIYDTSLFVLSSNYEGMPNALMEAMTMGLPVISTDCPCGGPRFLIKNYENGILVKVNDTKALTQEMINVLSNSELSMKLQKNARKIAIDLNPTKICNEWYSYILKIYKQKQRN